MARYTAILCGGDFRETTEPNNTCPNRANHTYGPAGYVDWFEWAAKQNQSRCPGCDRYLICTPKRLTSAPSALPDAGADALTTAAEVGLSAGPNPNASPG